MIKKITGTRCIKLTIDGNFAINGHFHGYRTQQPIEIKVSMVVTIDGKVTTNDKFCATGPRSRWRERDRER